MATELVADELRDLKLDEDRQVFVAADKDLGQTSGVETVQQSLAINSGSVLRPLVGSPLTAETLEDAQQQVVEILRDDPQINDVRRVEITEVNAVENKVEMRIFVGFNNEFDIEVDL